MADCSDRVLSIRRLLTTYYLQRAQYGHAPMAMMDRSRRDELPKMQVQFIDSVCMGVYEVSHCELNNVHFSN